MSNLKSLFFLFVVLWHSVVISQISFSKKYSGSGYDNGYGLCQTADTGYLITGNSSSFSSSPSDVFLLKLDSLGDYEWSWHYGGNETDIGVRVRTVDGIGHYVAGYSNSYSNGDYDFLLIKTDESGNELWKRNYGTPGWERLFDAAMTSDSGMMMVGETTYGLANSSDLYLVRTDQEGDTLWTRVFGGVGQDAAKSIRQFDDTTFIVGGYYFLQDSLKTKGFLMKLHENGTVLWFNTIGENGIYQISDVDIHDGRINFVGFRKNSGTEIETPFYGRTHYSGILDYAYHENPLTRRTLDYISTYGTEGKKYMAYRYIEDLASNFLFDVCIARLQSGLWWDNSVVLVGNLGEDVPGPIVPTSDGGVITVVTSTDQGLGGKIIFIIKIGPNSEYPIINTNQESESIVEVNELFDSQDIQIYPNPTNGKLSVESDKLLFDKVQIVDLQGKIVFSQAYEKNKPIQLDEIQSGTYILELLSSYNKVARKRIVFMN